VCIARPAFDHVFFIAVNHGVFWGAKTSGSQVSYFILHVYHEGISLQWPMESPLGGSRSGMRAAIGVNNEVSLRKGWMAEVFARCASGQFRRANAEGLHQTWIVRVCNSIGLIARAFTFAKYSGL